ncbi:MAG: PqqD family protein [Pseudomonadota bacterium]
MKLVQSKDYFIEAIEGEWLLFKPRAQKAIYLDESASIIWQMCDGSRSADELAQEIASNYGDEKDTVIADVHATLAVLQEHGALKGV